MYCAGYFSWTFRKLVPANTPTVKLGSLPELPAELLAFATGTVRVAAARRAATGVGGGGTSAPALDFAPTQASLSGLSELLSSTFLPLFVHPL